MKELLYQKIYSGIRSDIEQGLISPGSRLDGVRELAVKWDASTNTVLKALRELEVGGYIRKTQGQGIFVEKPKTSGSAAPGTGILELILYDLDVPLNKRLVSAVEKSAADSGFTLTVKTLRDDDFLASENPLIVVPRQVPGDLPKSRYPVVFIGDFNPPADFRGNYAVVDSYSGYYRSAELLLKSGRERIAYISGHGGADGMYAEAGWNACRDLLSGTNSGFRRDYAVTAGGWNAEKGEEAMENLLLGGEFPDGIVCSNDALAAGVLKACRRAGLSVPGDVAVTGAGDGSIAPLLEPPLTSLVMSAEAIAFTAVSYIRGCLAGIISEPLRIRADMELAERESTEAANGEDWL